MSDTINNLPKMPKQKQLYLVVCLVKGTVTDHEFVMGVDQVRQRCLVHVNDNPLEKKASVAWPRVTSSLTSLIPMVPSASGIEPA